MDYLKKLEFKIMKYGKTHPNYSGSKTAVCFYPGLGHPDKRPHCGTEAGKSFALHHVQRYKGGPRCPF